MRADEEDAPAGAPAPGAAVGACGALSFAGSLGIMLKADSMQQMIVEAIPAFADNYIWALRAGDRVAVVDPGDATPVLRHLERVGGRLVAILITHHHGDHTGGIADLVSVADVPVYGPTLRPITGINHPLHGGERISIDPLGCALDVWHAPGHTLDHLIYVGAGRIFCGDTLFAAGCGRLFEGTGAQMFDALMRLSRLPDAMRIHCAHEYTVANLRFARAVEPDNTDIARRMERELGRRERGEPTLPSTLALERATNPFLRCHLPAVRERVRSVLGVDAGSPVETFIALRQWKDDFR